MIVYAVFPKLIKTDLISLHSNQSTDVLLNLRQSFFDDLVSDGLGNEGDELVGRRCSGSKPLPVKLSEDICSLLHCRKNNSHIPRSIVKNGKRDKNYLEASRAAAASSQPATISAPSTNRTISDQVALSSVMKELNMLKESMRTLVSEVSILHRDKAAATRAPSTCHVSVLCQQPCSAHELPSLLGCPVLNTVLVGAGLSWKVKIHKENLYNALQSSSVTLNPYLEKQPIQGCICPYTLCTFF